jgi:hypothetical protein
MEELKAAIEAAGLKMPPFYGWRWTTNQPTWRRSSPILNPL